MKFPTGGEIIMAGAITADSLPWRSLRNAGSQHGLRVAILLLLLVILNAVDLAYTLLAHHMGMLNETNPIAETFLRTGLTGSLVSFKLLLTGGGCIMLWKLRPSRWTAVGCWGLVAVYATLCVVWYIWVREITFTLETQMALGPLRQFLHH